MVDSKSLYQECAAQLYSRGFVLSHDGQMWGFLKGSVGFVRRGAVSNIFEFVTVVRRQNSIQFFLRLSAVPTGNTWRQMVKQIPVTEEAHAPLITNTCPSWNKAIGTLMDQFDSLFETSTLDASTLQSDTEAARSRAAMYLAPYSALYPCRPDLMLEQIRAELSPTTRESARLMTQMSLVNLPCHAADEDRMLASYKCATAIIVSTHENGMSGAFSPKLIPDQTPDLAVCIQIMASQLFAPHLWNGETLLPK